MGKDVLSCAAGTTEEVCALSRLPLAALTGILSVSCEGRSFLVRG